MPTDIRIALCKDRRHLRQIEHLLFHLAAMGLIAIGRHRDTKRFKTIGAAFFFVSKRGEIYDTSTSAHGYATVSTPISQYKLYEYQFNSDDDVLIYWQHLRAIVASTQLSHRSQMQPNGELLCSSLLKMIKFFDPSSNDRRYAMGCIDKDSASYALNALPDRIMPFEPRDGVCGFDSRLFM